MMLLKGSMISMGTPFSKLLMISAINWVVVVIGWFVSRSVSKGIASNNERNKSIDIFNASVNDFEGMCIQFWCAPNSTVIEFQLIRAHSRLTVQARDLCSLTDIKYPSDLLLRLRQAATLYNSSDLDSRPESQFSARSRNIISSSTSLQKIFHKKL